MSQISPLSQEMPTSFLTSGGIWLLLPAKDEEDNIGTLVRLARRLGYRVVVCDDGSLDRTAIEARKAGATVLAHETNKGLAAALRTLFNHFLTHGGPGDWAVTMDGDGTMSPKDGLRLIEAGLRHGADIVIGSRYRGKTRGIPLLRWLYSYGARFLFTLLLPIPGVSDYTTGFRAYRYEFLQRYAQRYPTYFRAQGFSASTELLLRARGLDPKVVEVGVYLDYGNKGGNSKMRVLKTILEYLRLALSLRLGLGEKP